MQKQTADIQRALEILDPLRGAPADCFERILQESPLLRVAAGTHLFDEQAACNAFPIVLEGAIRVSKLAPDGREITLYRVTPGESCVLTSGCLLGGMPYTATGIAETDVMLVGLSQPVFDALLLRHEPFRRHIFGLFGERLADLTLLVEEVAFRRLDQRLAALLVARGPMVHATHQALADELGSVREIITRLLGNFAASGWVRLAREQIAVVDHESLSRLAQNAKPPASNKKV